MIKEYKKKNLKVEAIKYNGNLNELYDFCYIYKYNNNKELMVRTSDGKWLVADKGDYIVSEGDGGFYPVKPDIFVDTYKEIKS